MNVLHQQVNHPRFGFGTVAEQTETFLTVSFEPPHGAKTFLYPAAFDQFLTLNDPTAQQTMQQELQAARETALARKQQQEAEAEARRVAAQIAAMTEKKKTASAKRAATRKANAHKI